MTSGASSLQCIAKEMTNEQIAAFLGIKENTVKTHRKNLYEKLEVHNAIAAVNKGRAMGYIT
ncbi:MAG: LuxR C-terminal-related transcriptional regulator [Chitinophagales bacterium]|nr:LuxR C-terminal-related transcriptional regulator [Chitinophagales bacterium]